MQNGGVNDRSFREVNCSSVESVPFVAIALNIRFSRLLFREEINGSS